MPRAISDSDARSAVTRQVAVRVEAATLTRAEHSAQALGTTLTRILTDHIQELAGHGRRYASFADWLNDPRKALWDHLEKKHR